VRGLRGVDEPGLRPADEPGPAPGARAKGAAGLRLFVQRQGATAELRSGEPARDGDRLLPWLEPGGAAQVLVALVEPGEASLLFSGAARAGPLPEAFEWTGTARKARLVAVFSDRALEAGAALAALRAGRAPEGPGVQVVELELHLAR
jgi:hypothetical protein